jgi:hypothetical protein
MPKQQKNTQIVELCICCVLPKCELDIIPVLNDILAAQYRKGI